MRLGAGVPTQMESISTGALNLDAAIGIGGIPCGRITEIYGPESSGKTTLMLHVIAEAQRAGKICAFIDAEHALDPIYAQKIGVKIEDLLLSQPDTGEMALGIVETLVNSHAVDVIVVDSVAALVPKSEIEGDMGDSAVGVQARLMSQALRKLTGAVARSKCAVLFINQLREKIGVMWGSPETTTGGKALKFYASLRLDIRRQSPIKDKDEVIGHQTKVKVVKNKCAPPFRQAEFPILFGVGIDRVGMVLDMGVEFELIAKSGSYYSVGATRLGNGREVARKFLGHEENRAMFEQLEHDVRARLTGTSALVLSAKSSGDDAE
jgi:recombination protein RecA